MSTWFVTGTGTDIGKTYVSVAMIRAWRAAGRPVRALKPVASGYQPAMSASSDAGRLLAAMGAMANDAAVAGICPWRFADPVSPDLAAARVGRTVDFDEVVGFCRGEMARAAGNLLIEGVGGAMVPLGVRRTVRDWIAALGVPAVVVAGGYLGAISHTLCTAEALRAVGVEIGAVVLNPIGEVSVPIETTREAIARHVSAPVLVFGEAAWDGWVGDS